MELEWNFTKKFDFLEETLMTSCLISHPFIPIPYFCVISNKPSIVVVSLFGRYKKKLTISQNTDEPMIIKEIGFNNSIKVASWSSDGGVLVVDTKNTVAIFDVLNNIIFDSLPFNRLEIHLTW